MLLSIIIPTFNEEKTIAQIITRIKSVNYTIPIEIIIIDDASIDRTYEKEIILRLKKDANIRLFKNRINKGKGFSIRKGIRRANGNIIIIQDADMEYDPNEIPKVIAPILQKRASIVYGSRFLLNPHPAGMAFANRLANRFLTALTNLLFGTNLTDMETCYKAFLAEAIKPLKLNSNRFSFEPEITALSAKRRIPILEVPITYKGRSAKDGKKIKARDFFFAIGMLLKIKVFSR